MKFIASASILHNVDEILNILLQMEASGAFIPNLKAEGARLHDADAAVVELGLVADRVE